MAKEYKDLVVGLDIGTAKIMVVVAEVQPGGELKLAGLGVAPSNGLKRGVVVNIDATVQSIQQALKEAELTSAVNAENSEAIRNRVEAARALQLQRQGKPNFALGSLEIDEFCQPDEAGLTLLKTAISRLNLSARAYHRILKLARTIADVSAAPNISAAHIAEAVQYRRGDVN